MKGKKNQGGRMKWPGMTVANTHGFTKCRRIFGNVRVLWLCKTVPLQRGKKKGISRVKYYDVVSKIQITENKKNIVCIFFVVLKMRTKYHDFNLLIFWPIHELLELVVFRPLGKSVITRFQCCVGFRYFVFLKQVVHRKEFRHPLSAMGLGRKLYRNPKLFQA